MASIDVRLIGFEKLHARITDGKIANVGLAESLEEVVKVAAKAAKDAAPVATGKLQRSVQGKIRATGKSAVVEATAKKKSSGRYKRGSWPNPFPYPRRLEYGPGRHNQWMRGAIDKSSGRWESALSKGGQKVASHWKG